MLKFSDKYYDKNGDVRYKVYRNGKLLTHYQPNNEGSMLADGTYHNPYNDNCWRLMITRNAIDLIEGSEKIKLTEKEKKQVFDFYGKGDKERILVQIKHHKEEIKKLEKQLTRK